MTEEQLSAKLLAAKQRSQDLAAAHARAQADADEFAERERVAGEKRRKEEGESKRLHGERERNRARKLGGREGREWDRGKEEGQGVGGRGDMPRMQGGGEGEVDLREYEWHEDRGRGRGVGRGGRGGRRGNGGRGRGGGGGGVQQSRPDVSAKEDFPSLPSKPVAVNGVGEGKAAGQQDKPQPPVRLESDVAAKGKSWAEQMDE